MPKYFGVDPVFVLIRAAALSVPMSEGHLLQVVHSQGSLTEKLWCRIDNAGNAVYSLEDDVYYGALYNG